MAPVVALIKDLMFSSKISTLAEAKRSPYVPVRNLEELTGKLAEHPASVVVINLGIPGELPFEGCALAVAAQARVLAYGPHVDLAAFERARACGVSDVVPRSKLLTRLEELLS